MTIRVLEGDCRAVLRTLPDASVHCVVTSPPYYGLRDYGTAQWDGGDAGCDHARYRAMAATTLRLDGREHLGVYEGEKQTQIGTPYRDTCGKCGAKRIDSQIGLEPDPETYIATMVAVFREVRRVMRPDATLWMNVGDSFADKQLLMMPARLALALQADGWWIRSDIIWAKPNPMPESVTDRPTSAHEHVFLLTKQPRYYYDADAVREERLTDSNAGTFRDSCYINGNIDNNTTGKATSGPRQAVDASAGRNCRNVWSIATAPFPEAHFATFPPALAERCSKAGTSERGCCAQCGAPWARETSVSYTDAGNGNNNMARKGGDFEAAWSNRPYEVRKLKDVTTIGWSPTCQCNAATQPCTVLDPFAGAGTTGLVADRLQRNAVLIELNPAYCAMMRERLTADAPLFMELAAD